MMLNLFKALHTGIAATSGFVLLMYVPAIWSGLRQTPRSRAWFLVLGICLTWAGALCSYGWLAWLYWVHGEEPILRSPSPILIRLMWLSLLMTGGAIHIAAAQRERMGVLPGFLIWSLSMAVFVGIVTVLG